MSPSRIVPLLRLLIVVVVVGIVVLAGALLKTVMSGAQTTPRTEAERAVVAAEEAVKANPNDGNARIKLAAAYIEQGSTSKAVEQANIAIRLRPTDPSPYYVLGLAYDKAGDRPKAIEALKKCVGMKGQLAPFYQDAWVALAHVQEAQGDYNGAMVSLDNALHNGQENAPLFVERAQLYARNKDWFNAAQDYAFALQYLPDASDARTALENIKREHPKEYKQAMQAVAADTAGNQPAGQAPKTPSVP